MAHLVTEPISFTTLSDTYLYFQIIIILSVGLLPVLFQYSKEANMVALVWDGTSAGGGGCSRTHIRGRIFEGNVWTLRQHAWAPAGYFPGVDKLGAWGKYPSGSRDRAPVWVWAPLSPEADDRL